MSGPTAVATSMKSSVRSTDWLAARHPWNRRTVLLAAMVGLTVCALAIVLRTEIVPTDPWRYVQSARDFPDDSWVPLGYTRYGMILPLLPLVALFGDAAVTYYFWPVLCSGLLASSLYLIAYRFWARMFAGLAVVLGLISPITFINLSRGYPDLQSTGLFAFAVVLAFVIRDRLISPGPIPWWLWLAPGFLLGWAFEARETTILVWPIVALVLGVRTIPLRGLIVFAAGIASWAFADVMIGIVGYGDALMRVHAFTRQDLATATNPADLAARAEYVGRARSHYVVVIPSILATKIVGGPWTLFLGGLGLIGLGFRGGARFVSIWFALAYLTFVGITGGFIPDHPSGRIDLQRYWIAFLPFLGLAAAGATAEIAVRLGGLVRRRQQGAAVRLTQRAVNLMLAVIVAVGPGISLTTYASREPQLAVNGADQLTQLRKYLAGTETTDARIYTDRSTDRLLPIYQRGTFGGADLWSGTIVNISSRQTPQSGDLVVINSLDNQSCFFCYRSINKWYEKQGSIPEGWQPIWSSKPANLTLYRVT